MAVGAILAAWNTLVGGTMGDYYPARLVLEDVYYFAGSVALTGLGAALEWRALRGRYERRGR